MKLIEKREVRRRSKYKRYTLVIKGKADIHRMVWGGGGGRKEGSVGDGCLRN